MRLFSLLGFILTGQAVFIASIANLYSTDEILLEPCSSSRLPNQAEIWVPLYDSCPSWI